MKKLLIIKIAMFAVLLTVVGMSLPTESARADTKCKIHLGFGNWTEGCPHFHGLPVAEEQQSHLPVMVPTTYYEFRIINKTGHVMHYKINEERFWLYSGNYRNHKYLKNSGGSHASAGTAYPRPSITFDYSYASGYQARTYGLGYHAAETFKLSGNGVDLYH